MSPSEVELEKKAPASSRHSQRSGMEDDSGSMHSGSNRMNEESENSMDRSNSSSSQQSGPEESGSDSGDDQGVNMRVNDGTDDGDSHSDRSSNASGFGRDSNASGLRGSNSWENSKASNIDSIKQVDEGIDVKMDEDEMSGAFGATAKRTAFKTIMDSEEEMTVQSRAAPDSDSRKNAKIKLVKIKRSQLAAKCDISKYVSLKDTDTMNSVKHKLNKMVSSKIEPVVLWNIGVQMPEGTWFSDKLTLRDMGVNPKKLITSNKLEFIRPDKNKKSKEIRLLTALAKQMPVDELEKALEVIRNVNFSDCKTTLLHAAIENNAPMSIIEEIVNKGANLELRDNYGDSPHLCALRNNQPEVFRFLCEKCPEMIESCNINRIYPTQMAIIVMPDQIASDIIKFLLSKGADITCRHSPRKDPIGLSCVCNKPRCTYYLCKNGAPLTKQQLITNVKLCKHANNGKSIINLFISYGYDKGNDKTQQMSVLHHLTTRILVDQPHLAADLNKIIPSSKDWVDGEKMEYVIPPNTDTYFMMDTNDAQIRNNKLQAGKKFNKRFNNDLENAMTIKDHDFRNLAVSSDQSLRSEASRTSCMSSSSHDSGVETDNCSEFSSTSGSSQTVDQSESSFSSSTTSESNNRNSSSGENSGKKNIGNDEGTDESKESKGGQEIDVQVDHKEEAIEGDREQSESEDENKEGVNHSEAKGGLKLT